MSVPIRRAHFAGVVAFEDDGWLKPWRLPFAERGVLAG